MEIVTIPCLRDNFAYLLICPKTGDAAVVDPSESEPVRKEINHRNVKLKAILNTHHHWDHVGGNKELKSDCPDLKIYGHASDKGRIPVQTEFLEDGDQVLFGEQSGSFLHNPGHTSGAITYLFGKTAFTGDTLLINGTGRTDFQNGNPYDSYNSIFNILLKLPDKTKVYPAHDYNGNFFSTIEKERKNNPRLQVKSADEYADIMNNLNLPNPKLMDIAIPRNLRLGEK